MFPTRLIGHTHQQSHFLTTQASGSAPHAWLLTGRKGVGKRSFALLAAAQLLGAKSQADDVLAFDANDQHLRLMQSGAHPDLTWVQRAVDPKTGKVKSEISVEQIRKLKEGLYLTPSMSTCRVAIIDAVDEMNRNSANAVLKLLEEPPAGVYLFLVCHNPSAILPTIRSRCAALAFSALTEDQMQSWRLAQQALLAEQGETDWSEAQWQAAITSATQGGQGVPGVAFALLEKNLLDVETALLGFLSAKQSNLAGAQAVASLITKSDAEGEAIMKARLFDWLHAQARMAANNSPEPTSLASWQTLWDKTQERFDTAEALNLDERGLWTSALLSIKSASGS